MRNTFKQKMNQKIALSLLVTSVLFSAGVRADEVNPGESAPTQQNTGGTLSAFMNRLFPITPDEIRQAFEMNKAVNQAATPLPPSQSQIQTAVKRINLSGGTQPPLLHIVQGYIANIQFVGTNGAPWPVASVVSGNQSALSVSGGGTLNPYNVTFQAITPFVPTNVAVYLVGRSLPVMLYIQTEQDTQMGMDVMVNFVLDGYAPGTHTPTVANRQSVSDALLNALDAYPGDDWSPVGIDDKNSPFTLSLWTKADGSTILKLGQGQLVSPNWEASVNNADNTVTAYQFTHVPLLFVIADSTGHTYQVSVTDPTQTLASTLPQEPTQHASVREF